MGSAPKSQHKRRTQSAPRPIFVASVISSESQTALAATQHKDRWREACKELEATGARIRIFHDAKSPTKKRHAAACRPSSSASPSNLKNDAATFSCNTPHSPA